MLNTRDAIKSSWHFKCQMLYLYSSNSDCDLVVKSSALILWLAVEWSGLAARAAGWGSSRVRLRAPQRSVDFSLHPWCAGGPSHISDRALCYLLVIAKDAKLGREQYMRGLIVFHFTVEAVRWCELLKSCRAAILQLSASGLRGGSATVPEPVGLGRGLRVCISSGSPVDATLLVWGPHTLRTAAHREGSVPGLGRTRAWRTEQRRSRLQPHPVVSALPAQQSLGGWFEKH